MAAATMKRISSGRSTGDGSWRETGSPPVRRRSASRASSWFSRIVGSATFFVGNAANLTRARRNSAAGRPDRRCDGTASIRFSRSLTTDWSYLFDRLTDAATGALVYSNTIVRLRIGDQFTRVLSLRAIVRYNRLSVDAREDVARSAAQYELRHPAHVFDVARHGAVRRRELELRAREHRMAAVHEDVVSAATLIAALKGPRHTYRGAERAAPHAAQPFRLRMVTGPTACATRAISAVSPMSAFPTNAAARIEMDSSRMRAGTNE